MTIADAEVPRGRASGTEAAPKVTRENRGLYLLAFWFLGIALLTALGGWIVIVLAEKEVPDALPVLVGTIVGGFVGVISSDKSGD